MAARLAIAGMAMLLTGTVEAQDLSSRGPEVAVALLDHGVRKFGRGPAAPDAPRGSERERGTADVQFLLRGAPVESVLGARPTARIQLNAGGRTSFAALGAEWRQGAFGNRLYAQLGFGVAVHDGLRAPPNAAAPGLDAVERARRAHLADTRTAFGSRVLFNPNASVGARLNNRWGVEAAWEHFSHKGLLARRNPGIDTLGVRLVRIFGER